MRTAERSLTHFGQKIVDLCERAEIDKGKLKHFISDDDQEGDKLDRMTTSPKALREIVGETNQPALVKKTADAIARLYSMDNPKAKDYDPDRIKRGVAKELNQAIEMDLAA